MSNYFQFLGLAATLLLLICLDHRLVDLLEDWIGRAPCTVESAQVANKEFQKFLHLLFILNNQVNVSALHLESKAIPGIEWDFAEVGGRVDLLPEHPEPGRGSSNHNTCDVLQLNC